MIVWRPDNLIEFFFIASLVSSVLLFTETENFHGHKYKKSILKIHVVWPLVYIVNKKCFINIRNEDIYKVFHGEFPIG